MEIQYFQEKNKNLLIHFRYWDDDRKHYLDNYGNVIYVPEGDMIPESCNFYIAAHEKLFEDAVLELANKIKLSRTLEVPRIHNGPPTGSWDAGGVVEYHPPSREDRLIDIIKKLVDKSIAEI